MCAGEDVKRLEDRVLLVGKTSCSADLEIGMHILLLSLSLFYCRDHNNSYKKKAFDWDLVIISEV